MKYLFILIFLASCKNLAYIIIAPDTQPSERNKKILLAKCQTVFPLAGPEIKQGRDNVHIDTIYITQTETLIKTILDKNCPNVNTDSLERVIKSAMLPVFITKTITRTDTIDRGDSYTVKSLLNANNELKKKIDVKDNIILSDRGKLKNRFYGWVAFALSIVLYILRTLILKRI